LKPLGNRESHLAAQELAHHRRGVLRQRGETLAHIGCKTDHGHLSSESMPPSTKETMLPEKRQGPRASHG
jgi:hypothetical protein